MTAATSCVEFSFNNIMFRQIDGVAMGSPLGPALANIFVGYYENKLFASNSKPSSTKDMLMTYSRFLQPKHSVINFLLF